MISIIVCTYNREKYIVQCLESIARQNAPVQTWELVIVNNKSTDHTPQLIADFLNKHAAGINVSSHLETNQGLSYARNRGMHEAKGDVYVFIDDDAFLVENYVTELINYLAQFKDQSIGFGGKIVPFLECELPNWMSPYLMPLMSVIDKGSEVVEFKNRHYPIGANMGFKKETIDKAGNFNVELGRVGKNLMGGEEKDLFVRIRNAGARVFYFPKIMVHHVVPESRLTVDFIRKQALGVGSSERIRVKTGGIGATLMRTFLEMYKWAGSIFLYVMYLFTGRNAKGVMIIRFRYWVSKGLFSKIKTN